MQAFAQHSRHQADRLRRTSAFNDSARQTILPAATRAEQMKEQYLDATVIESAPPEEATHPRPQGWREFVDNPWLMVLTLFFVTAALGLPLLWISRGFSWWAKVVLTFAVLAWTALVFWVFYLIMAWCLPRIWEGVEALFA
jgi:hypothetical protein